MNDCFKIVFLTSFPKVYIYMIFLNIVLKSFRILITNNLPIFKKILFSCVVLS